ncbi:GLPGLI family protein [Sphingobacterium paramultivorum]|uniref:GLPGLI family protein n=1 Tax=Sphingobacterium paramultivorum TaxID=2886510 RepID=A0A7G5E5W2_9SPHI|nr:MULTISPECIES: GLPGLI family protein [Sphingobacterium]QMV69387.1 GLPGLI family protein [Sphingobacterium paramultivorum]WSO13188.1 GLPGLI family protein [Sphingobacterium paramultivorum]
MKYSLPLLLSLATQLLFAQERTPAIAKVHYEFKHVNDSTQRDQFIRDETVVYLNQQASYYTSYSSKRMQDEVKKQMEGPSFDGTLNITTRSTPSSSSYLLDANQNKMTEVVSVASDNFAIPQVYPIQDWEILGDRKEIGGYNCQNAKTTFKGRTYIAWFTTELPFSYGPWKLHGLPGLILDARDTKNEVIFAYAGFDKIEDGKTSVALPQNAIVSTVEEVKKVQEAFKANPQAYMQAQSGKNRTISVGSSGNMVAVRSSSGSGGGSPTGALDPSKIKSFNISRDDKYKPSKVTNNPIELTP